MGTDYNPFSGQKNQTAPSAAPMPRSATPPAYDVFKGGRSYGIKRATQQKVVYVRKQDKNSL
jgi:hypothetical protein